MSLVTMQAPNKYRKMWDEASNEKEAQERIKAQMTEFAVPGEAVGLGICPKTWQPILMWRQ